MNFFHITSGWKPVWTDFSHLAIDYRTYEYVYDAYVYGLVLPGIFTLPVYWMQGIVQSRGKGTQEHYGVLQEDMKNTVLSMRQG